MSEALRYRRTLVVSTSVVERNWERLLTNRTEENMRVWLHRLSNERFLRGLRTPGLHVATYLSNQQPEAGSEIALHEVLGSHPVTDCAVSLESHVYGLRTVEAGDGVSYGALYVAPSTRLIGLAPVGFADGIDRKLSGVLRVRVDGWDAPVVGRIAMDSLSIDVTDVPGVHVGSVVSVYGDAADGFGIADAALSLGITTAEIICRLSERAEVVWR